MSKLTPWGNSDYEYELGCGITSYSTPSHGGLYIKDPSILPSDVTSSFINGSNWAEEDCEAVFVIALLFDRLNLGGYSSMSKSDFVEKAISIGTRYSAYSVILKHL